MRNAKASTFYASLISGAMGPLDLDSNNAVSVSASEADLNAFPLAAGEAGKEDADAKSSPAFMSHT
jgi:hypothetical protein